MRRVSIYLAMTFIFLGVSIRSAEGQVTDSRAGAFQVEIARVTRSGAKEVLLFRADGKKELLWSNSNTFFSAPDAWVGSHERADRGLLKWLKELDLEKKREPASTAMGKEPSAIAVHADRVYVNGVEVDPSAGAYDAILERIGRDVVDASDWKQRDAKRARLAAGKLEVETVLKGKTSQKVSVPVEKACRLEGGKTFRCLSKMGWHIVERR